ncbi:uncharacterized protein VTP21DRAFT_5095 [Calcarisporiella thermophila]|uniref:uncharacterized protein n=1 Tax=Calcarisporiella thermophila TaxID=911321 RepID=UPI003741F0DE
MPVSATRSGPVRPPKSEPASETKAEDLLPRAQKSLEDEEGYRRGLVMMTAYITNAIKQKDKGLSTPYEEIIRELSIKPSADDAPTPLKLRQWIHALSGSISLLNRSCYSLVRAILAINWCMRDNSFVRAYISFLGDLVSSHAYYVVPVQKMLVKNLAWVPPSSCQIKDTDETLSRTAVYDRVHAALQYVLTLVPTGTSTLMPILVDEFPHKRQSLLTHLCYLKNLFRILEYSPILHPQVMNLIIDRIIQVDVEIQVEQEELDDDEANGDEVEVFELDLEKDEDEDAEDSDNETDEEEGAEGADDSDADDDSEGGSVLGEEGVTVLDIEKMVQKLDGMLLLVFDYLTRWWRDAPLAKRDQISDMLLEIFDTTILPTFKSRYTQFLFFYFFSFDPAYPDYFLGNLMQIVHNDSQPQVIRISAAAYISSFVARAKYLNPNTVRFVVYSLCNYCSYFLAKNESSVTFPDANRYGAFYAVVQAIMYIFCFRWRILRNDGVDEQAHAPSTLAMNTGMSWPVQEGGESVVPALSAEDGEEFATPTQKISQQWCPGLPDLHHILLSRFNPLKVCSPNVVKIFAKLAHETNFLYVYPIIEKNKRMILPTAPSSSPSYSSSNHSSRPSSAASSEPYASTPHSSNNSASRRPSPAHDLETFFPFDPFRLKRSSQFVNRLYQEWQDDDDEDDEDEDDEEEEEEEGLVAKSAEMGVSVTTEGEGEEEMRGGFMAMSISPAKMSLGSPGVLGAVFRS